MAARISFPLVLCTCLLALPPAARAADVTFGIGYAHLNLDDSDPPFDEEDGVRLDARFTFSPVHNLEALRLGFGLSVTGYDETHDSGDITFVDNDGDVFTFDSDETESLTFITPEVQLSWRQVVIGDRDSGLIIEPGAGAGVLIGNYWVGDTFGVFVDEDISEWDATFGVRPFVRVGYQGPHLLVGAETAYQWGGNMDFTEAIQGEPREFYAGFFIGGRW